MRKESIILFMVFVFLGNRMYSQNSVHEITLMFYNLENMFHPSDDSLSTDDDFTPEGARRWSFYRYNKKLAEICKVILASNDWEPPFVIGLCELENKKVLEDIVRHPLLINFDYEILHRESPDHRGIDVGILYRVDRITCIDTSWLRTADEQGNVLNTREILCAKFQYGHDTILCIENHWMSKYGGAMETEPFRNLQAKKLGNYIDAELSSQPNLYVIAGGDFNDVGNSKSIRTLTESFSLKEVLPSPSSSTYKYQGKWESIDHVFVAGNLDDKICKADVVKIPFLLEEDKKYTGEMPRRTYRGFAYNGGISDHLPLLLKIDLAGHSMH